MALRLNLRRWLSAITVKDCNWLAYGGETGTKWGQGSDQIKDGCKTKNAVGSQLTVLLRASQMARPSIG